MRISYTPEQEELRRELRSYFAKLITPERREALSSTSGEVGEGNVYRETVAQMGKDGWLTLNWPKEYGGQDRSPMDSLIFADEAAIAGAPVPFRPSTASRRPSWPSAPRSRRSSICRALPRANCTSPSATPNPALAPTWPTCGPPRCATATTTSSTARR